MHAVGRGEGRRADRMLERTLESFPFFAWFLGIWPRRDDPLSLWSGSGLSRRRTGAGRSLIRRFPSRHAFADGDPNAAILTVETAKSEAAKEETPALEMDPVLLDIFAKETAGHLQIIKAYLEACQGHEPPFQVTDKLYRACHTLHGSANMANVERGVAVAGALNRFVRRVYDYKIGFQKSGTDALRAAAQAIASIVNDVNKPVL